MMKWILLVSLLIFVFSTASVSAVQVKLSIQIPLASTHTTEGFDNSTLATSSFGLKLLTPVAQDSLLGLGVSLFKARVKDGSSSSPSYEGIVDAIIFEVGADYSGIEISEGLLLVIDISVEFPIGGEGKVVDSNGETVGSATSVSGMGYYLGTGMRWGNLEGGFFYKSNELSYGEMTTPRDRAKEISLKFTTYGIVLGYLF